MNTSSYILAGWAVFLVLVYGHIFYDINAPRINFRKRWHQLRDAFTEEE
ncbi:MAG: hypothetical protein IJ197_04235 [Bacteroidaceae bacterium]|nr:hypothetical protein [Bacteroidaceae bacterium]